MKIYWDRAGNDNNVGRDERYIYVEWEDLRSPNPRLLIDITWITDSFIEKYVLPSLEMVLETSPPVYVKFLSQTYIRGESEFLVLDKRAVYRVLTPWDPYIRINYKRFWKQYTYAKMHTFGQGYFLEALYPEIRETDAVEIDLGKVATLLVPRKIYDIWVKMRDTMQGNIQRMLEELEKTTAVIQQQQSSELEVEFE